MKTDPDTEISIAKPGFPSELVELSTFLLSKLGVEAKRRSCEMLNETEGLVPGHQAILFTLDEFGPSSQKDLGERLRFDASDIVALVDELERRHWVERKVDPRDRRRYAVTLTPEGQKAQRRLAKSVVAMNRDFLSVLSAEEREVLPDILRKLLAAYDVRVPR